MKNTISLIALLALVTSVTSQNIITWCYQNSNSFDGISHHHNYLVGDLMTDSVAESEFYWVNYYGESIHVAHVRADSTGKVYANFFNHDPMLPEILLYDYSLEVGDTMFCNYGGFPPDYFYEFEHYKVVIDKQTVLWGAHYRRVMTLESFGAYCYYESIYHEWIEGYGCLTSRGFTTPLETDGILNGDSYSFNCVLDNGTPIFVTSNCYCNPHDLIDEQNAQNPIIMINNQWIIVECKDPYLVEITDITGKTILKEFTQGIYTCDASKFGKGMFIIRITGDKFSTSQKFISSN
jgi:hypothetical protein